MLHGWLAFLLITLSASFSSGLEEQEAARAGMGTCVPPGDFCECQLTERACVQANTTSHGCAWLSCLQVNCPHSQSARRESHASLPDRGRARGSRALSRT